MFEKKLAALVLLLFTAFINTAHANTFDCIELVKNDTLGVELKQNNNFNNCFYLADVPQSTPLGIITFSSVAIANKISLYSLDGDQATHLSDHHSDSSGANGISTYTTSAKVAFKITPTSRVNTNKYIHITYAQVNGTAQVIIEVFDRPNSSEPDETPECNAGDEVCREPYITNPPSAP